MAMCTSLTTPLERFGETYISVLLWRNLIEWQTSVWQRGSSSQAQGRLIQLLASPTCPLSAGRCMLLPWDFSFPFLKGGGETLSISSYKLLSYLSVTDKCSWWLFVRGWCNSYLCINLSVICESCSLEPPKLKLSRVSCHFWIWQPGPKLSKNQKFPSALLTLKIASTAWAKAVNLKPCEL